ncbi:MAG: ABC transporter ATP-binding protein [Lachnospiraceae bacterium]|nr:ABC transporter ATP-binding protein [Lachnospiraceae bacterium]
MLLEIKHVSRQFDLGKGKTLKAVDDFSLDLPEGENTGLVGESGCGKSTIARMITGLTPLSEGEIFFQGKRISGLTGRKQREVYRHIQMVFQDPYSAISPRMPIGIFLTEGLVYFRIMSRKQAAQEVPKLLQMVDLDPALAERLPHQLSGGQLQRVVIARAVSIHPRLVILDEATSALDVSVQKQVLELLVRLQKEFNLTYLFIGHDLAVVRSITRQICVMRDGRVVEILPSEGLSQLARHPYTRQLLASVFSMKKAQDFPKGTACASKVNDIQ